MKNPFKIRYSATLKRQLKTCAEPLQGWLKGVNSSAMLADRDMGKDGYSGIYQNFARDAFGYSIDYYNDSLYGVFDYLPIGKDLPGFKSFEGNRATSTLNEASRNLYNGNISYLTTAIPDSAYLENGSVYPSPLVRQFHYDKLNRLTKQETADFDLSGNKWLDKNSKYIADYALDPNGNFLTLNRKDNQPLTMDSLAYSYFTSTKDYYNGQQINRLQQVADRASTTAYPLDFEGTSNYAYDDIGYLTSDSGEEIDTLIWNTYGKIRKVIRVANSEKPDLEFLYDPLGNRLCKIVKPRPQGDSTNQNKWIFTWYLRDTQGNIMGVYTETHENTDAYLSVNEFPMYGSARLGVQNASDTLSHIAYVQSTFDADGFYTSSYENVPIDEPDTNSYHYYPLQKQYEMTSSLGNVLATISARPRLIFDGTTFLYKEADVISVSDNFGGGFPMPGRQFNSASYRFGHNTQEKVDEWNGTTGTHYTALYWEYDSRLEMRQNPDPKGTASISPYSCYNGNPILFSDVLGDSARASISRSLRKELGISRRDAKNYTPEKVAQTFQQEYGMNVEVRNGWLHYNGESDNQPTNFSPSAKAMWKKEISDDYKSTGKFLFTNKGDDGASIGGTARINLNNYDNNLTDLTSDYSIAPNDANLKRTWNLGRTFEHEFLGHVINKYDDFSNPNPKYSIGWGKNEFEKTRHPLYKTALQLVNDFRIEMGLENYQRLNYQTEGGIPMIMFGNPNLNTPLFPVPFK